MEGNKEQKPKDDVTKNVETNKSTNSKVSKKESGKNGLAITALILSILALPISFIPIINTFGLVVAIAGIILGVVAIITKQKKILSIIAIILAIIALVIMLVVKIFVARFFSKWDNIFKLSTAVISEIEDKSSKGSDKIDKSSKADEVREDTIDSFDDTVDSVDDTIDNTFTDEAVDAWTKDFKVEIGELVIVEKEYTSDSKLEVIVTNKTNERKSCEITIDAISPDGFRIEYDKVYIFNLGAGQKEKVEIFTYLSSSILEDMKTASFKVSEMDVY